MAKIQRKTQKIFASNTTADQITAFGTAKNTNPTYTTDLNAIQTDVYTQGWTPSLLSDLAPYLQDSNALWFLVTSQLAYLFQQGISEWDSTTEYTQGSLVSKYNNGNLEIYMSLQNLNTNHALTSTSWWKKYTFENIQSTTTAVTHTANTAVGSATVPVYIGTDGVAKAISSYSGNSATATKATQDGNGNNIVNTYQTKNTAVTHTASTAVGGANQGVYVNASGQVVACNATTSTYSSSGTTAVNGTAVASAISGKLNADLSNISATSKTTITSYSTPDYSLGSSKSWNTQYTADTNGWLWCEINTGGGGRVICTINGVEFTIGKSTKSETAFGSGSMFLLSNGDTYKASGSIDGTGIYQLIFFPLKGV